MNRIGTASNDQVLAHRNLRRRSCHSRDQGSTRTNSQVADPHAKYSRSVRDTSSCTSSSNELTQLLSPDTSSTVNLAKHFLTSSNFENLPSSPSSASTTFSLMYKIKLYCSSNLIKNYKSKIARPERRRATSCTNEKSRSMVPPSIFS